MTGLNLNINDDLLVKFLLGETNPEEFAFVMAWLNQSDKHKQELDQLETVWIETGKLKYKPVSVNIDTAWNKLSDKMDDFDANLIQKKSILRLRKKAILFTSGVAAVLMIGFALFMLVINNVGNRTAESGTQLLEKYLADGSIVTINQNSKLTYPKKFKGQIREVKLQGEAFFKIEPNLQKPFIVDAGIAQIKVLGTQFNVKVNSDKSVEVTVVDGKVELSAFNKVTNDTQRIHLVAGDKGIIDALQNKPLLVPVNNPDELFWVNKTLIFNDTKLYKVFETLEFHFNVEINVTNPKIYECPLTSTFINNSPDEILEIIAYTFNLNLQKYKNQYLFDGEDCSQK